MRLTCHCQCTCSETRHRTSSDIIPLIAELQGASQPLHLDPLNAWSWLLDPDKCPHHHIHPEYGPTDLESLDACFYLPNVSCSSIPCLNTFLYGLQSEGPLLLFSLHMMLGDCFCSQRGLPWISDLSSSCHLPLGWTSSPPAAQFALWYITVILTR